MEPGASQGLHKTIWPKLGSSWLHHSWIVFALFAIASLVSVLGWHIANLTAPNVFMHIDAPIPLAVKDHIREVNWPDTNWAHADLPNYKDNGQYNFSSYILGFTLFDNLSALKDDVDLSLFTVVCWLAYITVMVVSAGRTLGSLGASIVAAALAATPLLVQDSFYGRPESFLTLLTAAAFALSARDRWVSQLAASFFAGLGLACKVSFAPFVIVTVIAPLLLQGKRGAWRAYCSLPAVVLGFALGAPGAVVDPSAFLEGVEYLRRQYAGYHWPHGSMVGGLIPQIGFAISYYLATIGPIALILLLLAPVTQLAFALKPKVEWNVRAPQLHLLAFSLAAAATVIYFSSERTFFERNISHAVPILWFVVAWVCVSVCRSGTGVFQQSAARVVCLLLMLGSLLPMAVTSQRIAGTIGAGNSFWAAKAYAEAERRAADTGLPVTAVFAWHKQQVRPDLCAFVLAAKAPAIAKVITETDARHEPRPIDGRLTLMAVAAGPFGDLPISTLQTYHYAQVEYYVVRPELKPGECGL